MRTAERPTNDDLRPLLTVAQVAKLIQVDHQVVRKWIGEGKLPVTRLGRMLRITRADLDKFLQDRRQVGE